jgi:hypothetical protein
MRPVRRGTGPEIGGQDKNYPSYRNARDDLIARLGDYCSYCELPCKQGPAVEHVQPKGGKHGRPDLELVWSNFLLCCRYCNGVKTDKNIVLNDHFWPDQDNTFRALRYDVDRAPRPADGLSPAEQTQAVRTLQLTGLDREPGHPHLTTKDLRWRKRREAWGIALISLGNLRSSPSEEMRRQIVITALNTGFWSVWMTVFCADAEMRRRLASGFVGTEMACFDTDMNPIRRPGGRV